MEGRRPCLQSGHLNGIVAAGQPPGPADGGIPAPSSWNRRGCRTGSPPGSGDAMVRVRRVVDAGPVAALSGSCRLGQGPDLTRSEGREYADRPHWGCSYVVSTHSLASRPRPSTSSAGTDVSDAGPGPLRARVAIQAAPTRTAAIARSEARHAASPTPTIARHARGSRSPPRPTVWRAGGSV